MSKGGHYVLASDWALVCLKEAKTDEDALWLINGWAQGVAEDAFKLYKHYKEQQNEGNSEK